MELKIHIRQTLQIQTKTGNTGYYNGLNPQSLVFTQGTLPAPRQWPNYGNYNDVTGEVSDLAKLKLTWSTDWNTDGSVTVGANQQKKSASGNLTFEGSVYKLLKNWLVDDVSGPLNAVDVKIEHVGCGTYENYQIKATDLAWCELNEICTFDITLKQKDEALNCIKRILINDPHQNWFEAQPLSGKKHPRFSYCNEIRPNMSLIMQWYFMALTGVVIYMTFEVIGWIVWIILGIIIVIINVINAIISIVGGNGIPVGNLQKTEDDLYKALTGGLLDSFGHFFVEAAGCGREHPAPLIRDYISNVCTKCGVGVDGDTAPIFFASQITIQTSDKTRGNKGVIQTNNPHYNACYFNATVERGIRRATDVSFYGSVSLNTSDYYIPANAPLFTLDMFLDELKTVYNADWRIMTVNKNGANKPYLFFQRKDYFRDKPGNYVYDFSVNGADRNKLIGGICYEWNGKKTPASCVGLYQADPLDSCGNEARNQMNGYVEFGNTDDNPTFEGLLDKQMKYGATKFRLDGASTDYITDAMQICLNGTVLAGIFLYPAMGVVRSALKDYGDYVLLLKDETAVLPKILIWDGESYESAKCVKPWACTSGQYGGVRPPVNQTFNPTFKMWDAQNMHPPHTKVIGSSIITFKPYGAYRAADLTGLFEYIQPAMLVNYPMYFEPNFRDTMWDWFHWIDDPRHYPLLNMNWKLQIPLCCPDLKNLQVFNDASAIKLLEKVKLDSKYYSDGAITEITASYDTSDILGQYIELKGTV